MDTLTGCVALLRWKSKFVNHASSNVFMLLGGGACFLLCSFCCWYMLYCTSCNLCCVQCRLNHVAEDHFLYKQLMHSHIPEAVSFPSCVGLAQPCPLVHARHVLVMLHSADYNIRPADGQQFKRGRCFILVVLLFKSLMALCRVGLIPSLSFLISNKQGSMERAWMAHLSVRCACVSLTSPLSSLACRISVCYDLFYPHKHFSSTSLPSGLWSKIFVHSTGWPIFCLQTGHILLQNVQCVFYKV